MITPASFRRRAFTLVEMLAVMVIILVLVGVCLPALRGYSTVEGRHAAVSEVMAALDRARMMAIADGRSTYVVFLGFGDQPTGGPTVSANLFNSDAFGRSYAIFEDGDNVHFLPVQQTPWMHLPASMAFKVNNSSYGEQTDSVTNRPLTSSDPAFPLLPAVLANSAGNSPNVQLPYIKFDSTGVADEQDLRYLRVLMFPGAVANSGATGTELTTQTAATPAAQLALLEEIDINLATGRARYVPNPADNLGTTSPSPTP